MSSKKIILQNVSVVRQGAALLDGISFELPAGCNLLITGLSGSGKTLLLQALAGKVFYQGMVEYKIVEDVIHPKTALVEQHYYFKNKSNISNFYYQQRFNSADVGDAETVWQALEKQVSYNQQQANHLLQNFGMEPLKAASMLQLSSGEHKRFQMIKALLNKPEVLLLDEPYIGLDTASRKYLNTVLNQLAQNGCTIISISSLKDAPACMSHVANLDDGKLEYFGELSLFKQRCPQTLKGSAVDQQNNIKTFPLSESGEKQDVQTKFPFRSWGHLIAHSDNFKNDLESQSMFPLLKTRLQSFAVAVAMKNVTIQYGEKIILNNINWEVKAGEKWLLRGPNGAGKSTLISLITGDNPQAFANDIILFDRKKGSGESIWDIKKNIGYISPELQWHFDTGTTCYQAVASGLFDTMGLFRKLSAAQEEAVRFWLNQFELESLENKVLRTLPVSKQKLVLLARAMVKNPPMLILDEPCQGLDEQQKEHFLQIIEAICTANRTLIYVSHYTSEVPACIEKVIELKMGEASIYRLTPTHLLTERDKAGGKGKLISETKNQEPTVGIC